MPVRVTMPADEVAAAARRATAHLVKAQARRFARRPLALERLHPGLAAASPQTIVAIAEHLIERERTTPRRWLGFGGEVPLVNLRAARLLGRALRRRDGRSPP